RARRSIGTPSRRATAANTSTGSPKPGATRPASAGLPRRSSGSPRASTATGSTCSSARGRIQPQDRIDVVAAVPGLVALVEEVEARVRTGRELRILAQLRLEFGLQLRIGRHHPARLFLGHVGLHVLLALEGVVELAPGRPRV